MRIRRLGVTALSCALPLTHGLVASAQEPAAPAAPAAPQATPAPAAPAAQAPAQPSITYFPGGVAPTPPGQALGGGNTEYSSSRPVMGPNDRDSFDFKRGGDNTVRGGSGGGSGYVFAPNKVAIAGARNATQHQVRRGDTLWGICDSYFGNPYQWPRIWSYNPHIDNPHWIYPGDTVALREGGAKGAVDPAQTEATKRGSIIDKRRQVVPGTIFLRSEGWIEDDDSTNWGEINGSREDKMILSDWDEVYLRFDGDHDIRVGRELTVYRPIQKVGSGTLIEIQGTVRVDQWDSKTRVARARITEALDAIERGARVGPIDRKFDVVPPRDSAVDVKAKVVASVHPRTFYGQNQVVFIDKGADAGLKPGNRLFVTRKGDAWHDSLTSRTHATRLILERDDPAATEPVPTPRDPGQLPEEVQAELRVVSVKKNTAMCLVTQSRREIEREDTAWARKGL